jgi:predicted GTPase/uncharacterized protein (DUF697 family)
MADEKSNESSFLSKQIQNLMTDKIESIEKTPINIAVTGDSGTGKSTLVNTLRGLRSSDPAAAAVGAVETTFKPTPYQHPTFPNVIFWDLPGVGTPKNPKSSYNKQMNLKSYDFFLITISSRFTENTLWLAQKLTKLRKPYFFVRSKLDIEIMMKRKQNPNITDQQVINELRDDIRQQANDLPVAPEIYVLSGELENTDRWDFLLLKKRILTVLPDVKRNTLIISLGSFADELLDTKYHVLKKRIVYYSVASALGAIVPIPGFSFGVDTGLVIKMAHEFAKAFGLTQSQAEKNYAHYTDQAKAFTIISKVASLLTVKAIMGIITSQITSEVAEEMLRYIPLLGQGASAALSFGATYQCGKILLKKMRALAQEMAEDLIQSQIDSANQANSPKYTTNQVNTPKITGNQVNSPKITTNQVNTPKISANQVNTPKISGTQTEQEQSIPNV